MKEVWKNTDYEHYYISNLGRVKTTASGTEKILKHSYHPISKTARVTISLHRTTAIVNKMVYKAFYGETNKTIRHKDNDKKNCAAENLTIAEVIYKDPVKYFDIPTIYKLSDKQARVVLKNKSGRAKDIENKVYQKEIAERLDNFLLDFCPHGIYQEFQKIIMDRQIKIDRLLNSKKFNMNKFNKKDEELINQMNLIKNMENK